MDVITALAARARHNGSEPLLTWYRPETGARTDLSVRTVANWVDKTANLLDDLGVEGTIAGPVSLAHPGHWMSLVWPLAAWQHGCGYLAGEPGDDTELVVVGPEAALARPGVTVIACSLHPLGLGLRDLPAGVLDFSDEALAQPDAHAAVPVAPSATAWQDAVRRLDHDAIGGIDPQPGRALVRPAGAWDTLAAALLAPVLGGGSAVVVEGPAGPEAVERIATAERVTARVA